MATASENIAFSSRLKAEFQRRQNKNPAFSLRAFARQLEMDASELSKILRSQRVAGSRLVKRVGGKLGWSDAEIETVRFYQARMAPLSGQAFPEPGYTVATRLEEDLFAALSHWHYFAILSLLTTDDFKPDVEWIARRLGLGRSEVSIAVNRLTRLGLLLITPAGEWRDGTSGKTTSLGDPLKSTEARRELQASYLDKSKAALKEIPIEKRTHSTMTMTVDSSQLDAARELITIFRRDLSRLLSGGKKRDSVYSLNIGLFPLTKDLK